MIIEQPPSLNIDALFLREFNHSVSSNGRLERTIVWNLFKHLEAHGFKVVAVYDSEETVKVGSPKEAMELMFNLDEAWVTIKKDSRRHTIYFTLGEGTDIICDYSFSEGDVDGFDALMSAFDTDQFVA